MLWAMGDRNSRLHEDHEMFMIIFLDFVGRGVFAKVLSVIMKFMLWYNVQASRF